MEKKKKKMNENRLEHKQVCESLELVRRIYTKGDNTYDRSCHFGITCKCDTFLADDYVLMSERNLLFRARLLPMYDDEVTKHCVHLYINVLFEL